MRCAKSGGFGVFGYFRAIGEETKDGNDEAFNRHACVLDAPWRQFFNCSLNRPFFFISSEQAVLLPISAHRV